ncbi:MAG: protein-methionine-sulfoxide reductase catalytic subunit MsrP [Pyrinomonadaceae bacterium]|nr:protein-methionine-sulfoxide reductase catalytic subunit MsrP [Pyrinomonadaceae bacterium]
MPEKIKTSEITDEATYLNRRNFIKAGIAAGSLAATTSAFRFFSPAGSNAPQPPELAEVKRSGPSSDGLTPNTWEEITNYNNYYEFSTSKSAVAAKAEALVTRPWTVEVGGMVQKPKTFDIDELLKFDQEERIYRFRCVEAWSMVIPWVGFPLKKLIDSVEPLGSARYVAFQTKYDPIRMQSSFSAGIDFPYVEGLRLDEAIHPLTILATGLYGKQMPNQNGAPIRLVVPWKYGFKSIKSIVKIMLTDREPPTTWNQASPEEYGFYSNVNPDVKHPRWSQASERRIGEIGMRPTMPFNGYVDEVASLYSGMDLKKYF